MRCKDYANGYVKCIGEYQLVKRSWEKQVAIFLNGRCVATRRNKEAAIWFARTKKG